MALSKQCASLFCCQSAFGSKVTSTLWQAWGGHPSVPRLHDSLCITKHYFLSISEIYSQCPQIQQLSALFSCFYYLRIVFNRHWSLSHSNDSWINFGKLMFSLSRLCLAWHWTQKPGINFLNLSIAMIAIGITSKRFHTAFSLNSEHRLIPC